MHIPKRGKPLSFRLSVVAEQKWNELCEYRRDNNKNAIKNDILSQAVELLYEKEIGQWKPKGGKVNVNQ